MSLFLQAAEKPHTSLPSPDSLQPTEAYASAHRTWRALSLNVLSKPATRVLYLLDKTLIVELIGLPRF
jgi:hypothetical protein